MNRLIITFFFFQLALGQDLSNLSAEQMLEIQSKIKEQEQSQAISNTNQKPQVQAALDKEILDLDHSSAIKSISKKSNRFSKNIFNLANPQLFAGTSNQVSSNYPLKYGDKLILAIWGGPEEEYSLSIDRSGNVFIPEVGRVSLNGHTLYSAEQLIKKKLKQSVIGFKLGVAKISLRVSELSPMKVYVLGNSEKPSAYVLQGNSSVLNALYLAGGPNEIGSVRNVQLRRGRKSYKIDLYDYLIKGILPKKRLLRDGDVIFIPKAEKLVKIKDGVQRPSTYELTKDEGFSDLLKFAEGKTNSAGGLITIDRFNSDGTRSLQDISNSNDILSGKLTLNLMDGDIVSLHESMQEPSNFIIISGEIKYPGKYQFKSEEEFIDLITRAGQTTPLSYLQGIEIFRIQANGEYKLIQEGFSKNGQSLILHPRDSIYIPNKELISQFDRVSIAGAVKLPITLPYNHLQTAKTLFLKAGKGSLNWDVGKFILQRRQNGSTKIKTEILSFKEENILTSLDSIKLKGGDRLFLVRNPNFYNVELIKLTGSAILNQGEYPLSFKGETLQDFFKRVVKVSNNVQWSAAKFYRLRGEKKYPITIDFLQMLNGSEGAEIQLKSGDEIFVPEKAFTVQVLGEVTSPGDVFHKHGYDYKDYINNAGGLTRFGDEERIIIILANGARVKADDYNGRIPPGSIVLVGYVPEEPPIDWGTVIQGTVATLGAIASIVLTIVLISDRGNGN